MESWRPFGKFSCPGLHYLICTAAHPHATLTRRFCTICLSRSLGLTGLPYSSLTSTSPSRPRRTTRSQTCSRCAEYGPGPESRYSRRFFTVLRHRRTPYRQLQVRIFPARGLGRPANRLHPARRQRGADACIGNLDCSARVRLLLTTILNPPANGALLSRHDTHTR